MVPMPTAAIAATRQSSTTRLLWFCQAGFDAFTWPLLRLPRTAMWITAESEVIRAVLIGHQTRLAALGDLCVLMHG